MDDNILKLRGKIIQIRKEKAILQEMEDKTRKELIELCKHEAIYETPDDSATSTYGGRPFQRICVICGLQEKSWDKFESLTGSPVKRVPKEMFGDLWKLKPLKTQIAVEEE